MSTTAVADTAPATPGDLDDDALAARITALHRHEQQLAAAKLHLIAEYDHRKAFTGHARDTADWLTLALTMSRPEAAGILRTALALDRLPATAATLADGQTSVAQVSVAADQLAELDRLAEQDIPLPADTTARIDAHTADRGRVCDRAVLRRELAALAQRLCAATLTDKETLAHARRDGRLRDHPDATTSLWIRMGAVAGAKLRAYLDAQTRPHNPEDTRTRGQRIADAVIDLFDHGLQQDLPEVAARRPHALLITTPQAAHDLPGAHPALLDGHGPVSSATAAQICCDADITLIIRTTDGTTIDAQPWRAKPTRAQRAAVIARDHNCIGCGAPASRCEIHHIQWASRNGKTITTNLVLVCWNCHHRIHHDHWTVGQAPHSRYTLHPPGTTRHTP